ncbi:zinc-dependent metalloprotease [Saccharopolyspora gregorii]|uniref:Zinc-dependent metalloprotease n=1 Tax=Saccharopolyspora gregorii TaxID=33914 RepID=A0ABP6RZ07_9PSEU|nr:zinc-dependent metalloprotease [Saccharopolyspora sp. 6T]MCA1227995.1 zinc-dependent metalloprotease [Saccharopolyspora sp. 6M]MCA1281943.1 zinc-dependent metalloprotease [Saccharopolyspora sp. 7B]
MTPRSATLPPRPHGRDGAQRSLDWDLAAATAGRLMRSGPDVPREDAVHAVRSLRRAGVAAETHVRELTGLGLDLPVLEGDVVDRREWVRAAAQGLSELTGIALRSRGTGSGDDPLGGLGARGAGVQAGLVLSYLGTKVLGQYDPFLPSERGTRPGRLLLVAPNIVAAQRALDVPADDFTMWVCLHESTHRLQFNAVPWLRDHFADSLGMLLSDLDSSPGELLGRLPAIVRGVRAGPDARSSPGVLGVVELLQGPRQRAALDRILALSTLLEGHADHVMDAVGPSVVPSVATIRRRFTERRQGGGVLDRLLRSLLGVDAKMRQYAQGAAFTRYVVDRVGMDGFNAVWTSPEHLPTRAETTDPASWLRRVHG